MQHWIAGLASLLCLSLLASGAPARADAPAPLVFHASQPGEVTYDEGEGGGNPFASAFIDTMRSRGLGLAGFSARLAELTATKSKGRQLADLPRDVRPPDLVLNPAEPPASARVALVIVQSEYARAGGAPTLPGAAYDSKRVAEALVEAGFSTRIVLDADRETFVGSLAAFARFSRDADIGLIYTTGHGVEVGGAIHLLMGDFPVAKGKTALAAHAVPLTTIAAAARSKRANLVFYAGCREDPFSR